jgi:hypothetical protein
LLSDRSITKAKLEPSDLQLHECRHTFRSLLAAAGVPRDRRDRYTGHSDPSVGGRYEHQLDHSYLDDAKTFSDYLRRADTPQRAGQLRAMRASLQPPPTVSSETSMLRACW